MLYNFVLLNYRCEYAIGLSGTSQFAPNSYSSSERISLPPFLSLRSLSNMEFAWDTKAPKEMFLNWETEMQPIKILDKFFQVFQFFHTFSSPWYNLRSKRIHSSDLGICIFYEVFRPTVPLINAAWEAYSAARSLVPQ